MRDGGDIAKRRLLVRLLRVKYAGPHGRADTREQSATCGTILHAWKPLPPEHAKTAPGPRGNTSTPHATRSESLPRSCSVESLANSASPATTSEAGWFLWSPSE